MEPGSIRSKPSWLLTTSRMIGAYVMGALAAAATAVLLIGPGAAAYTALLTPVVLLPAIWLYLTCESRRPNDRIKHGAFLLPASIPTAYLLWLMLTAILGISPAGEGTAPRLLAVFLPALVASYAGLILTGQRTRATMAAAAS